VLDLADTSPFVTEETAGSAGGVDGDGAEVAHRDEGTTGPASQGGAVGSPSRESGIAGAAPV
jgi:hypothetical protein